MTRLRSKLKLGDPFRRYSVTAFFHFTDRRNLSMIREMGGLYSLVELRKRKVEIACPGGNQWSHDADALKGVDQYVHLCFRPNHPMEFRAREEGRIEQSIFLQIHPDVLAIDGVCFAPDVSNKSGVAIHPIRDAVKQKLIDFKVLYTRTDWSNPAIQARLQQAEKSELLVPDHVSMKYIRNCPDG